MIEIARLQNLLFHAVPEKKYDHLLANYKKLLHNYTVNLLGRQDENVDGGYESDVCKTILTNTIIPTVSV